MADADSEALLLDGIVGKYGDGSDFGDIADEDALLQDDEPDFVVKHSTLYHDETEELDHEPDEPEEEPDTEDVLDLEVQDDVELEDEVEDKSLNTSNVVAVVTSTQPDLDQKSPQLNLNLSELEERERGTDKFKNERQGPASNKSYNIPDSLDEVSVPTVARNNRNQRQFRGRGRGANNRNMIKNRPDNKTVLINPHFKGQVKIANSAARLTWDARHRISQKNNQGMHQHQVGRVTPFSQNRKNQMQPVQPWRNNPPVQVQNVPQYQQPPAPLYQPPMQQPLPQVSAWNQYQPNTYNQVQHQMGMNNQNVFMQPLPQNIFPPNPPSQFSQPPPHFTPPSPSVYHNQNINTQFPNPHHQYIPPNNPQFHQPIEPSGYHQGFNTPPQQQLENQFMTMPPPLQNQHVNNNRFVSGNQSNNNNHFRNQQRFGRQKTNFNQGKASFNQKTSPNKRKMEGNADSRKMKRNVASTNLHEVRTIETPDTTVLEEKSNEEDEDEETREYRKKIEAQKRQREEILAKKEERRKMAALQQKNSFGNQPKSVAVSQVNQQQQHVKPRPVQQRNLQVVRTNQPIMRTVSGPLRSNPSTTGQQTQTSNIKVINTNADNTENNFDKQHMSSFLLNRTILAKDQSLVDTSIVVVSNLAAGTTDVKLRRLCAGIGDIKKLQMSPKERQATIQFNSVASAHAFFKKYQRTMLDLSMIQVNLKPMS